MIFSPNLLAQQERFEAGLAAKDRGHYATALRSWLPMADTGDVQAQNNVGFMYEGGLGVSQSYLIAMDWYRKAADSGLAEAQHNIGMLYHHGYGVAANPVEALRWFKLAADQEYLRSKRSIRRATKSSLKGIGLGGMPNAVSIRERPASVEDRAVPGHWEGDLIEGKNKTFIATLVERHSRYVMLVKLKDKRSETVVSALIKQAHKLPEELYKSLTWDRGSEMTKHQRFTLETNIKVYFCDPQSPWQRGSNENTNRLLRDYLPKGTDLSVHSQKKLDWIARELNERPRKTLEYETPADRFNACVALTG